MTLWKRLTIAPALLVLLMPAMVAGAQTKTHHVLFVLTSGDEADWHMTVTNMRNMIRGFGAEPVETELVAYGPGLAFLKKGSTVQADIASLVEKHARFVACENSMRMQHVTAADLAPGVGTVPSGVIELVTKQEAGWAYIKAGR